MPERDLDFRYFYRTICENHQVGTILVVELRFGRLVGLNTPPVLAICWFSILAWNCDWLIVELPGTRHDRIQFNQYIPLRSFLDFGPHSLVRRLKVQIMME